MEALKLKSKKVFCIQILTFFILGLFIQSNDVNTIGDDEYLIGPQNNVQHTIISKINVIKHARLITIY
jgi:hypothetical protein